MLSRPMLNRIFPQSGQYQYPYSVMGLFFFVVVSRYCHRNIDCYSVCAVFQSFAMHAVVIYC